MDEGLDYSNEEQMRRVSSAWDISRNAGSVESLSRDPSKLYLQYKNYHLHLVQKMDCSSMRLSIPSTKAERYSYYRNYTTTPNKCQIFCLPGGSLNIMFWSYIVNCFFKSLPHTYATLFLSAYSPEEHLFLPKMVPFFHGSKWACLVTSVFELLICLNHIVFIFGYLLQGIDDRNPWNRCPYQNQSIAVLNESVACLELAEFYAKVNGTESWKFKKNYFESENGDKFQLAQLWYFSYFLQYVMTDVRKFIYFGIIWSGILFMHKYIFTRRFWKILHRLQLSVVALDIYLYIYLAYAYFYETHIPEIENDDAQEQEMTNALLESDIDFLAESMTAPPVLHILTARSSQDILPSHDSFLICLSNGVSYLFRAILTNRLRIHCRNLAGTRVRFTMYNPFSWFYYWPLFFSQFYWGELFTLAFLALNFVVDFISLNVTYHCLMETVTWEWSHIKQWVFKLISSVIYLIIYIFIDLRLIVFCYICTKVATTFVETFAMYYIYPVGRLIDDVIFNFGAPPTKLRMFVWSLIPTFYFVKLYIMVTCLAIARHNDRLLFIHEWCLMFGPYVAGIVWIIYKYIIRDKRSWQRMFVPDSDWGPLDHQVRQLRKEFNSRTYIGSQARRQLSRYMIDKQESKAFQLNLNYDPNRRSTMATTSYRMDTDKKET